ncbi:hypothetical protein QT383_15720 [Stenotrophomonas rhizophila]
MRSIEHDGIDAEAGRFVGQVRGMVVGGSWCGRAYNFRNRLPFSALTRFALGTVAQFLLIGQRWLTRLRQRRNGSRQTQDQNEKQRTQAPWR